MANNCTAAGCLNGPDDEDNGICDACREAPAFIVAPYGSEVWHQCRSCYYKVQEGF
jgi:hypothetical protein